MQIHLEFVSFLKRNNLESIYNNLCLQVYYQYVSNELDSYSHKTKMGSAICKYLSAMISLVLLWWAMLVRNRFSHKTTTTYPGYREEERDLKHIWAMLNKPRTAVVALAITTINGDGENISSVGLSVGEASASACSWHWNIQNHAHHPRQHDATIDFVIGKTSTVTRSEVGLILKDSFVSLLNRYDTVILAAYAVDQTVGQLRDIWECPECVLFLDIQKAHQLYKCNFVGVSAQNNFTRVRDRLCTCIPYTGHAGTDAYSILTSVKSLGQALFGGI
jgi:hypothetical protein